jgi:indolepyruvate ferredoxin oxidoreductase beta subunit
VLLGAIAGSELLPFSRAAYEATIRQSPRGVDASLEGFARAFEMVGQTDVEHIAPAATRGASTAGDACAAVPPRILDAFPPVLHDIVALGYARVMDYQDRDYATNYINRLGQVLTAEQAADAAAEQEFALTREVARWLALWMAFDDIVRVADLKSRASRLARVRGEVKAAPEELLRVYDFFKPGVPELAGLLPGPLARFLLSRDARRRKAGKPPLAFALKLPAHSVSGVMALRAVASLRWLRKRSLRFKREQAMIDQWLDGVLTGLRAGWQPGFEVAQCGRLIKGYGSTNDRGKENLLHVLEQVLPAGFSDVQALAGAIRKVRDSALADDTGKELDHSLAALGAPPRPVKAQPVIWMKKPRQKAARA